MLRRDIRSIDLALPHRRIREVAILIYVILALEFLYRFLADRPLRQATTARGELDRKVEFMVYGLGTSTLFILIRLVYAVAFF